MLIKFPDNVEQQPLTTDGRASPFMINPDQNVFALDWMKHCHMEQAEYVEVLWQVYWKQCSLAKLQFIQVYPKILELCFEDVLTLWVFILLMFKKGSKSLAEMYILSLFPVATLRLMLLLPVLPIIPTLAPISLV